MSQKSPFYATLEMFKSYIGYEEPLSFEEWKTIPDDQKAAVLYVQFFPEIWLAWNKTKSFYTLEEDGVETIIQYLIKNVPIIENDPDRFYAKYIYRVAYNCLYCICHDIKRDRDRFELEISNIVAVSSNESDLDLFDILMDGKSIEEIYEFKELEDYINSLDSKIKKIIEKAMNGSKIKSDRDRTILLEVWSKLKDYVY